MNEKGGELDLSISGGGKTETAGINAGDWLNPSFSFPETGIDLEKELLRLIKLAIDQANGNVSQAARILGVPRDYVRYRLQKKEE